MLGLLIFFLAVCFATQLRPTSIEKEIFPKMAQDDNLFAFDLSGRCISTFAFVACVETERDGCMSPLCSCEH